MNYFYTDIFFHDLRIFSDLTQSQVPSSQSQPLPLKKNYDQVLGHQSKQSAPSSPGYYARPPPAPQNYAKPPVVPPPKPTYKSPFPLPECYINSDSLLFILLRKQISFSFSL